MIRFFTYSQYHNKRPPVGSTHLRVSQLIKYWPEAELYKYGEKPDVLIFQKVYTSQDYKFPLEYDGGKKILDICDPDWREFAYVKETIDGMDAVTCPTEELASFLSQLTDKPVRVIPDRFDMEKIPLKKNHTKKAKTVVWYGYSQNAEVLQYAVDSIFQAGLNLLIISNDDPMVWRYATDQAKAKTMYSFKKYDEETIYTDLQEADMAVLPFGNRPIDRFKSDNKTIKAILAGLPVANTADEMREFIDPAKRKQFIDTKYDKIKEDYDVRNSVKEYKELIDVIASK